MKKGREYRRSMLGPRTHKLYLMMEILKESRLMNEICRLHINRINKIGDDLNDVTGGTSCKAAKLG